MSLHTSASLGIPAPHRLKLYGVLAAGVAAACVAAAFYGCNVPGQPLPHAARYRRYLGEWEARRADLNDHIQAVRADALKRANGREVSDADAAALAALLKERDAEHARVRVRHGLPERATPEEQARWVYKKLTPWDEGGAASGGGE